MAYLDHLTPNAIYGFAITYGILVVATLLLMLIKSIRPADYDLLRPRIRSWMFILLLFFCTLALGNGAAIIFIALMSYIALKEYFTLIPTRRADRRVLFWAYLSIPFNYYWIYSDWYGMFIIFIPVYVFLYLPTRMILIGETKRFLTAMGSLHWGVMACVFCLSHTAYLLVLDPTVNPAGEGPGLVLFLIGLTQFNELIHLLCSRLPGASAMPGMHSHRTATGLLAGMLCTALLALAIAPFLTPFPPIYAAAAGLLIALAGFIGSVTIAAFKESLGITTHATPLPGQGGVLHHVDSLIYTAPLFFHYTLYLCY